MSFYKFQLPKGEAVSSDFGMSLKLTKDEPPTSGGKGGDPGVLTEGVDDPQVNPNLDFFEPIVPPNDLVLLYVNWYASTAIADQASEGVPLGLIGVPKGKLLGRIYVNGDNLEPHEEVTWSWSWYPSDPGDLLGFKFIPLGMNLLIVNAKYVDSPVDVNYPQELICTIRAVSSMGKAIATASIVCLPWIPVVVEGG